jgi:soluble lytic murein transglycosylase
MPVGWLSPRLLPLLLLLLWSWASPARAALSESDRQVYREAFQAARAGDWPRAGQRAEKGHDHLLAKVLWWLNLTRSGSGASFGDFKDFITANPEWPAQLSLRQHAEEAMLGVPERTLGEWFDRYPPVTPAGKFKQADIWIAQGRQQEGLARIREVWAKSDFTAFEEKSVLQRYHDVLHQADHWARLDRLLWDGQTEAARRAMARVDADHRALADARLRLAAMEPGVERLVAKIPPALQNDPGLLFERMRWRTRKEHYEDAIAMLEHPPHDLVRPLAWAGERQILARHALAVGDISVAYRLAAHHGLSNGPVFAELEFFAGWVALRFLREPDIAYNHFVRLYDEVKLPVSVARGAYWAGRAAEAMNYRQLAQAWYATAAEQVTTYYGQLAATALGDARLSRALIEPKPTAADIAAFDKSELVNVMRELAEVGAADYIGPFARRVSELARSPGEHVLLAHLVVKLDRADLAIAVAKKASYAGVTLINEGYPVTELPPGGTAERPLVLAMTRQESAFDREAVSSAGARGMMQLMPATASHIAKTLHLPFSTSRLLTDSRYNITLGRHYLDGLLGDFSGSYVLAIAAYNAGPSRVRQWIREYGDPRSKNADVIDWIESIPLGETRNYVQRVLENLQMYRLRLGDRAGLAFSLASDLKR